MSIVTTEGPVATPLLHRLVEKHGACWVDLESIDIFLAQPGDRVLFFSGDAARFPEGQDVAAVLPELQAQFPGRFTVGVVPVAHEDALARRFGSQRWPALVFVRDGRYVTTLPGMHDWSDFVEHVREALATPTSRAPTVGIAVVAAQPGGGGCH